MNINLRKLDNSNDNDFIKLHKWCSNKTVYEWFEQRILSLDEIKNKYKKKLNEGKQSLFIIQCDGTEIGLIQLYKFDNDISNSLLDKYNNIYEFDIYIGEDNYLSKGIGSLVINYVKDYIYSNYNADAIMLRPFKRNERAVKCYEKCHFKILFEYSGENTLGDKEQILVLINNKNTNN